MTDEKVSLQIQKDSLYQDLVETYRGIKPMREGLEILEERYRVLRIEYERVDHALALVDGRVKKLTSIKASQSKRKVSAATLVKKLTSDQIDRIAKELGL